MSQNLQVVNTISSTIQTVQDASSNNSALSVSTTKAGVGINGWGSGSVAEFDLGDGSSYVQNNWGGNFVLSSNNAMIIQTSASNRNITIMPNGTGKVGIGNSNPGEKLEVSGKIKANNGTGKASLNIPVLTGDPVSIVDGDIWITSIAGVTSICTQVGGTVKRVTLS